MENTQTPSWSAANKQATKEIGGHAAVGRALGYAPATARQMAFRWSSGAKIYPPELCYLVEKAAKTITRRELRPDDWQNIWPELVQKKPKKAVDAAPASAA